MLFIFSNGTNILFLQNICFFGRNKNQPWTETISRPRPLGAVAVSKHAGGGGDAYALHPQPRTKAPFLPRQPLLL